MDKLAKALVGFQADMEPVTKDATNPFFKSRYATLEAILSAAKPHLSKHGLAIVQLPYSSGLKTIILHESGQYLESTAELFIKDNSPQAQGSAITYMRRYALSAALGIATEDDDDAEATKPRQAVKSAPVATKAPSATNAAKKRIVGLLTDLDGKISTDRAEVAARIKKLTDLDPADDGNLIEIIDRLDTLVDEKNNK